MMKRVGVARLSPDGKWVVLSVTEPSYDEKKETVDLWIVPAEGGAAPRRLTSSRGGESGADWSPDSRRLAFTAKREDDDVAQVYVHRRGGRGRGPARDLRAPGRARPDVEPGRQVDPLPRRHLSRAPPTPTPTRRSPPSARTRSRRSASTTTSPSAAGTSGSTTPRPTCSWCAADGDGPPRDLLAGSTLAAQPGFGAPGGEGSSDDFSPAWAPDGSSVVFVGHHRRGRAPPTPPSAPTSSTWPWRGGEPRALDHRQRELLRAAVRARRTLPLLPHERRVRDGSTPLDRLACAAWPWTGSVTPAHRRLRPLGGRLRHRAGRPRLPDRGGPAGT